MRAEFRQDVAKGGRILLAGVALSAVSVMLVVIGLVDPSAGTLPMLFVGGVGVLFFGTASVVVAWRMISGSALIAIEADGLMLPGAGLLRWRDIGRIWIQDAAGQRMLGIMPLDLDAYLARLPPIRRWLARLNVATGFAPIAVPENAIGVSLDELIAIIERQSGKPA